MRCGQFVLFALFAVVAVAPASAAGGDRARPAVVPFKSSPNGDVVVPVLVGGRGPYRFVLDTGSSHTVMSETLAATLGAAPVAKAPLATSTGTVTEIVVRLTDVAVGSARVDSLLATSVPDASFRVLGDGVSGVLGQDFLSQFNYTIDYRSSSLSWDDDGDREEGVRLALEASEGRFLVRLPQDERCQCPVRLVPDSGATDIVLFTGTDADRLPVDVTPETKRLGTLTGDATVRVVILRELRVGSARLENRPAARIERRSGSGGADGLLPLHLFARVSFNHREGYVVVQPR